MKKTAAYKLLFLGGSLLTVYLIYACVNSMVYSTKDPPDVVKNVRQMKGVLHGGKDGGKHEILSNNKEKPRLGSSNVTADHKMIAELDIFKKSVDKYWSAENQLLENTVSPNIHYMWCGEKWFEFKHYLSFVSVIRSVRPYSIVLHYEKYPQVDKNLYNLWLDDLKHDFQFLIVEEMDKDLVKYCSADREEQLNIIANLLNKAGGMYISELTWLLHFPPENWLVDIEISLAPDSMNGYVLMRQGVLNDMTSFKELLSAKDMIIKKSACSPVHQVYQEGVKATCVIVIGSSFERFWPMDIWELDDPFGRLCRRLFYGTDIIKKPKPTYDTLVPNIGHMIWIGGGPMDFVFYMSLLSMLFVAKVDVVYLHGDAEPTGYYWQKINGIQRIRERIKCIHRPPPKLVYQGVIEPWYRALMSDIIRVDIMIKYGGVYTDVDAIWVKPLAAADRGYDAVACFDWIDWSYPYPDSVNFGISYGKKNAPFWRLFRESMRTLHNEHHGFTGVMYPYKLLEKYPDLIRIDKRLSVICYYSKCHPVWIDDYHNMDKDHTNTNSIPNWRQDVHAFHWTHPNPEEYKNETTLLAAKGIFAEIGKFVLESAGLL